VPREESDLVVMRGDEVVVDDELKASTISLPKAFSEALLVGCKTPKQTDSSNGKLMTSI